MIVSFHTLEGTINVYRFETSNRLNVAQWPVAVRFEQTTKFQFEINNGKISYLVGLLTYDESRVFLDKLKAIPSNDSQEFYDLMCEYDGKEEVNDD